MPKKSPAHVCEYLKPGESSDKLVRRFFKKCKKQDVVREYLDKTSYFKSKREKKREKMLKRAYELSRK